jgi:hypothetical protein
MDGSTLPIGEILNAGVNGFVAYLIYNLIQQNNHLIKELREYNKMFLDMAFKAMDKIK